MKYTYKEYNAGAVAQLVRAPALQAGGCGIVPHQLHF